MRRSVTIGHVLPPRRSTIWRIGLATTALLPGLLFFATVPAPTGVAMTDRPQAPDHTDPPRARDGDIAIREEFQAATTAPALRLFVERHPGHPLAAEARERLRALGQR